VSEKLRISKLKGEIVGVSLLMDDVEQRGRNRDAARYLNLISAWSGNG